MLKEKQKEEAIKRMKALELHKNAIREFGQDGKLNKSETMGALYWLNKEEEEIIKEWEEETKNLAYHIILSHTNIGDMLSILYVSTHEDEWDMDNELIKDGMTIAYVKNLSDDYCSEYGSIAFRNSFGGLIRTA